MKIGIGIDTGGTCTDAVIYNFEKREVLAFGKTPTTKRDLSVGIGKALDTLPRDLVDQAEIIALSTTLATNACVEDKGGRAKLILFGIDQSVIQRVGHEYGLYINEDIVFIDSETKSNGEYIRLPDWKEFREKVHTWLDNYDAVGVVELFANKSGAELEKKAQKIIQEETGLPVVCGHLLFSEYNIAKRGATALLNARLLSVIKQFLEAVQKAMDDRGIEAPFVIVRSDGTLMTGDFTAARPVETLLCGPVASVMGAAELTDEPNCVVVDIGGTTTDVAFVKKGEAQRVKSGIRIGQWDTFVKGLFVDTFGLGGDSGVYIEKDKSMQLQAERVMPLCMAASLYPELVEYLDYENRRKFKVTNQTKNIYLRIREIENESAYTPRELLIANLFDRPMALEEVKKRKGEVVLESNLERLVREGILIRCGVTPTDAMHVKGDFNEYNAEASRLGIEIMSRLIDKNVEQTAELIYDTVKRKLYSNLVRILIEDAHPEIRKRSIGEQVEILINDAFDQLKEAPYREFFGLRFTTPATLVGVGAPTKLFIGDVARMLGTRAVSSEYSPVANALGAVVGNVSASVTLKIRFDPKEDIYTVFGHGDREAYGTLEEAKEYCIEKAREFAIEEAIQRGADASDISVIVDEDENIVDTDFGVLFMGFEATATASGNLKLK